MNIKEITIEVSRSINYQTVKYSSLITIEEGDNIESLRLSETKKLNKLAKYEAQHINDEEVELLI